ncbi:MAG: iron-containing alcohol dehydrogenase [Albidovulum sp.]
MTLIGYLTRTQFADGAIDDALPEEASGLGSALALVDTEPGAAQALARVRDALPHVQLATATMSCGAPLRSAVRRVMAALDRADASTIIAIGGAGAIGQARLVAEASVRRGAACAVIAVPVSLFDLGLGRQVRPRDGEPVRCPRPDRVIADPTALAHVPPRRLAAAGMEILVHAIEAYASPTYNPPADGLALEAVRRLARWLPLAVAMPDNAEALREALAGALTAGLAMEKDIGGVDALAHPLEDELAGTAMPGELHAPVLAAFVDFNARAVGDRYGALSDAMGQGRGGTSLDIQLATFARALGLPTALRDTATDPNSFAHVARRAADDPAALANPRLLTRDDCERILEAAW